MSDAAAPIAEIRRQVEFYFSDSNWRRDKFLVGKARQDPGGFVPISVLLTFNRLKKLTTDPKVIVESIKDSDVVQASREGDKLRRSKPMPLKDDTKDRTIYVKGFPAETTLDQVIAFLDTVMKQDRVVMRRDSAKAFKGSVFVEARDPAEAQRAVASHADKAWEFNGTKIEAVHMRNDYYQLKKERRAMEAAQAQLQAVEDFKKTQPRGIIVKVLGVEGHVDWRAVQETAQPKGAVKYVEIDAPNKSVYLRCADKEAAAAARDFVNAVAADCSVADKKAFAEAFGAADQEAAKALVASVMAGKEEEDFIERMFKAQRDRDRSSGFSGNKRSRRDRDRDSKRGGGAPAAAAAGGEAAAAAGGDDGVAPAPEGKKTKAEE